MPNPSSSLFASVDGLWLIPMTASGIVSGAEAWIGTDSPGATRDRDEAVFYAIGRDESITQTTGVLRLDEGTVAGMLLSRNGLTGDQWQERLENLIANQPRYKRIWLVTRRINYVNVELSGYEARPSAPSVNGWDVSFAFREKR